MWDIDEKQIDALPVDFVVQRVLSYGTLGLIIEAIKKNGLDVVQSIFLKMKPSAISTKKYHYLKNYLLA
ncbi:MAG: hypothetical protein ACYC48_02980 [Minisyncoccota bacterium]